MQSGFSVNEVRVKSSSPSSLTLNPSPSPSLVDTSSFTVKFSIPSASGIDDHDLEEKPKINGVRERVIDEQSDRGKIARLSIPVPSLISVTATTAEASSMHFTESYRVGEMGEATKFEQVLRVNQRASVPAMTMVPLSQSQPGTPYQFCCFPCNNICFSSAAAPILKQKIEVFGSSYNPPHVESLFGYVPGGFYQDSVFNASFMPVQAVFQNPLFAAAGPLFGNSIGGTTSVPMHKQKLVRPSYSSSVSVTSIADGEKSSNLESSAKHGVPPMREHNSLEASPSEIKEKGWIVLVQKELRNTDVGNLGRIVLPKKDAEANLPPLVAKDGLVLQMDDMTYSVQWKFKYRYWPNNRSSMYVMENTGEFVRLHNLQAGDFLIVYKEENSGKYIARGKKGVRHQYSGDIISNGQLDSEEVASVSCDGFRAQIENNNASIRREPFDFEKRLVTLLFHQICIQ